MTSKDPECNECRLRNINCDGNFPACQACFDSKLKCSFLENTENLNKIDQVDGVFTHIYNKRLFPLDLCYLGTCSCPDHRWYNFHDERYNHSKVPRVPESKEGPISIKLICHKQIIPQINDTNEIQKINLITNTLYQFTTNQNHPSNTLLFLYSLKNETSFDSLCLISYSILIKSHPSWSKSFFHLQNRSINYLTNGLFALNDINILPLLIVSVSLEICSHIIPQFLWENPQQQRVLMKGPISILNTAQNEHARFPGSTPILKAYKDCLDRYNNYSSI